MASCYQNWLKNRRISSMLLFVQIMPQECPFFRTDGWVNYRKSFLTWRLIVNFATFKNLHKLAKMIYMLYTHI